jgi:hypothetical protein
MYDGISFNKRSLEYQRGDGAIVKVIETVPVHPTLGRGIPSYALETGETAIIQDADAKVLRTASGQLVTRVSSQ